MRRRKVGATHNWDDDHTNLVDLCAHGLERFDKLFFFKDDLYSYTFDESDEAGNPLKENHIQIFISLDISDEKNSKDILNTRNAVLRVKRKSNNILDFNKELDRIKKLIRLNNM